MAAPTRIAAVGRVRNAHVKPLNIGGSWVCVDCSATIQQSVRNGRKLRTAMRCRDCNCLRHHFNDIFSGKQEAARLVARARRLGELRPPSDFDCVDCARPAECYDHRDYGRPLQVVPVCRSCNVMRGYAKPVNPWIVAGLLTQLIGTPSAPAVPELADKAEAA